jgi:hypothetical protein
MGNSGVRGKMNNEKNLKLKISCQTLFKSLGHLFVSRFWILGVCSTGTAGLGILGNVLSILVLSCR